MDSAIDTTLLGQEFQYTAGPTEAAEWVRTLGVSTVVPYATFTFSRWATPRAVVEFAGALEKVGQRSTLFPLRPLDALDLSDLNGLRSKARRRFLYSWHHVGSRVSAIDRRMRRNPAYRVARRLLVPTIMRLLGDEPPAHIVGKSLLLTAFTKAISGRKGGAAPP